MDKQFKLVMLAMGYAALVTTQSNGAIPTGAGPYNWADYLPTGGGRVDARPETALTADQTWIVETPRSGSPFYPGCQGTCDYWQIWTGASITASGGGFRVMKGNVVFENAVISKTTENYIGYTGPVRLCLRNGGSFLATAAGVNVGRAYNNGTAGTATVFLEEPSSFAVSGQWLSIGATLPGAVWLDGGTLSMTNGCLWIGDGYEGYLRLNGGEVSLRAEDSDRLYVGCPHYGSVHVAGGRLTARNSSYAGERHIQVGRAANTRADVYADGGEIDLPNARFSLGQWNSGVEGLATLTVDGTADVYLGLLAMGTTGTAGTSVLNLNGGRFRVIRGLGSYGNSVNKRWINFDGGILASMLDITWPTVVYPGGGTIHVASSKNGIPLPFRTAKGYGVQSIELTSAGSGYVTAPCVTITGGSGSNATAYAVLKKDRTIEKIVVTCRGEGYAAGDQLTVALDSTTGSGAMATVTLAANGTGTLHKTGAGHWQQTVDSAFDGDIAVDEGYLSVDGVSLTALNHLYVHDGAGVNAGRSGNTTTRDSAVSRIDMKDGVGVLGTYGDSGKARLTIGTLTLDHALALVPKTNDLSFVLTDPTLASASAASSPVVHGLVYKDGDASAYRSPSLFERAPDGTLSLITTTSTVAEDANFCPDASNSSGTAPEIASLNCAILPLTPSVEYYVKNTGLVEIKSGMILYRRPQPDCQRFEVTGGGAFTTRAPGGMMIYGDDYQVGRRSCNTSIANIDGHSGMRRLFGPFADPDANTPMALTVVGRRQGRPEQGTVAWLINGVHSYSGGLNLVNGGVFIKDEGNLGTSGSPVRAFGHSSISACSATFNIANHPISIADDAALIFSPVYGNSGNVVASALSGEGDLLTSDVVRPGYAIAYTGDHSAFAGAYYIQGHARIAPTTFSPLAAICLADGTNGVGVIETSGSFVRAPGMGAGELCWKGHDAYKAENYGLRGGFSAYGGALTVNLGGDARKLAVGSDYLPAGTVVQLQSQYADAALDFRNGFELGGRTQKVNVWSGKTATLSGAVSDDVGSGCLDVTGNLAFAGTLEVSAANLAADAPLLAVSGNLACAAGAKVVVTATAAELRALRGETIPVATCGSTLSGTPTLESADPSWQLKSVNGALVLKYASGTCLIVR